MKNYLVRKNNGTTDIFDEAFDNFFKPVFFDEKFDSMKTDIKETENGYEMDVEIPGFNKEDISISLDDGYVVINASKNEKEEDEKKDGVKFLRKERSVSCSRSYYVGDVNENDIKAKYDNGILSIDIPKVKEVEPQTKKISIE